MNLKVTVTNEYKNKSETERKEQFLNRLAFHIIQQESRVSQT